MPADPGADDLVALLHLAFGDDPEVETGPVVGDHQRRHLGLAKPHADPETGDPRLGDLELGLADPVPVTDVHLVVGQAVDREVLAELPVLEVVAAKVLSPVLIGLALVDKHGALFPAVAAQIALPIAVDIEPADHPRALDGVLEDSRVDGPTLPGHV